MWTKLVTRIAGFALVAGLLSASAPLVFTFEGSFSDSAVVREMVESQIAAGDGFIQTGAFGQAEGAYQVAATLDRARGATPVEAVRRIANLRFYRGDYDGAAKALVHLADEAAAAGDRRTEFWASIDAAYLSRLGGDDKGLERSITRAQELLDSGLFSGYEQDEVTRIVTSRDLTVFAPHLTSW